MSPASRSVSADLAVLLAELRADRQAMGRHADELAELLASGLRPNAGRPELALAAVSLHGWYTALESGLERVARVLDLRVPTGDRSHRELLSQMTVEIPGVRPPVFDAALERNLDELLKFRHFFRHAYRVDLDVAKLALNARIVADVSVELTKRLDALEAFLSQTLREA